MLSFLGDQELQALRKADADELGEVQTEVQTEHAQKKEVEQEEQKRLQCSVKQQQSCRCQEEQENRYAAQVEPQHMITHTHQSALGCSDLSKYINIY